MSDVIRIIREVSARREALYRYAQAHDHFATEEQTATAEGREIEAAGAHEYALMTLRAYRNEIDDPPPVTVNDDGTVND